MAQTLVRRLTLSLLSLPVLVAVLYAVYLLIGRVGSGDQMSALGVTWLVGFLAVGAAFFVKAWRAAPLDSRNASDRI